MRVLSSIGFDKLCLGGAVIGIVGAALLYRFQALGYLAVIVMIVAFLGACWSAGRHESVGLQTGDPQPPDDEDDEPDSIAPVSAWDQRTVESARRRAEGME